MVLVRKLTSFIDDLIRQRASQTRQKEAPSFPTVKPESPKEVTGIEPSSANEGEMCCVCLSGLEERDEVRLLPCAHRFHRGCVDRWLNGRRKTCPVCRFSVGEDDGFRPREVLTEELLIWFSSFHVAGF